MPKRTNEFQEIVAAAYRALASAGATVRESVLVKDRSGTTEREIDILAEMHGFASTFRLAIECRDRGRVETLEWVDALIGKFSDLPVDKAIAVSPKGFSRAAASKAAAHKIELVTVKQALSVDWAAKLVGDRKVMTHSFTLMRVVTEIEGHVVTWTDVTPDGRTPMHRDALSEAVYEHIRSYFHKHVATQVSDAVDAKIGERWQWFVEHPNPPRWVEFVVQVDAHVWKDESDRYPIDRMIFGVGVFFNVSIGRPVSYVIHDLLVEKFEPMFPDGPVSVHWVRDSTGVTRHIEARKG
ncbi:restriction endonuclease [Phenylobacterium sp.]|uniref:restriction endonuclease n=1 Tax=Phenylobacterium sp. TaxID=1871053 RepID=UPI0035B40090